jgi:mono/diheme cytochrome c family protein
VNYNASVRQDKRRSLSSALAAGLLLATGIYASQNPAQRPGEASASRIDFNRDIRQTLTKCFTCHGPDSGEGAAGLRLDSFAGATKTLPSGKRAIVPGQPESSDLLRRIHATDGSQMPPPTSHKTLSAEEKKVLEEWIRQGAEYKEHWAFVRPVRPPLPRVKDRQWPRNELDHFVLAKLEERGLRPEPEADRATLLRRVSLDLTGLPPTPDEVDAFLGDKSPNAYEKVVDRLLASPRYGERMAMDWMDYSRYADSNGYQADYERFQSRWRDWVIEAFNANMPYDQFSVEQIAGDLLPNATMEQRLATAFNRNHRINTEGGVIAEEWRVENVVDRVETTSAVWLGLTSGCARCHDHKYDPLTQKDFYRLYAYFNNVPETGSGEERPVSHPPTMKAPTSDQQARISTLDTRIQDLEAKLQARAQRHKKAASGWVLDAPLPTIAEGLVERYAFAQSDNPHPNVRYEGEVRFEVGRATGAAVTGDKGYVDLGGVGDFERDRPFSFGGWIRMDGNGGTPFSRMDSDNAFRGWEVSVHNGRAQAHLIHKWPENAFKIIGKPAIQKGRWTHVFVTYDGSSKSSGMSMYLDGKSVEKEVERDHLTATVRTTVSAKVGRRTNSEFFAGAVDDFHIFDRALRPDEVALLASTHPALPLLRIPAGERSKQQAEDLACLWSLEHDAEYRAWHAERAQSKAERDQLDAQVPAVMVMAEMPKPRDCYVLLRGQYDKHGEKVEAGVPSFLPELPKGFPNNRLGLARWIVSEENPLTARVTVNRLWERLFGAGIVGTVEDFGTRAEFPSHPELLDYLATEFIQLKWDLKATIRLIVTSASYRQGSQVTQAKIEADPQNRLLSRGPRFRLPGEVIRDQALFAAGLLVEKLGGPSVYPYMPEGVWDETNFYGNLRNYRHQPLGLYRRSLYTIWKRTAAPPNMLTFDVPSREACRVTRARTNTPLQALTLMNDVTFVEAARVLAQRMLREGGESAEERLAFGFKCVVAREPSAAEMEILRAGLLKRLARYRSNPEEARKLIEQGVYRVDRSLDSAVLAAYTVAASTILNLDEAVNKS